MSLADVEDALSACETAADVPKHNGGPGFSQWELEFLESIREQFDARGSLTERQQEILQGMYDRT